MTAQEALDIFKTPITTFKHGPVIQKILLELGDIDPDVSATRLLSILQETELRTLFLAAYPAIKQDPVDFSTVGTLVDINNGLIPYTKVLKSATNTLSSNFPLETIALLHNYLVKESPRYHIAVAVFTVMSMALIEAGEL